jgi:spectinomycin phosphotransferase
VLEKPDIQDERIIACLQDEYGQTIVQLTFLPLGADLNTAVYRLVARDETPYFLKLRSGVFDEICATLPKILSDQGIGQIIAPLATQQGQLWASLDAHRLILYPFVDGHNGFEVGLSDRQWRALGSALKSIHTVIVPQALLRRVQRETYSPQWRAIVKRFLKYIEGGAFEDEVAVKMAAFLKSKRSEILELVGRAERLALTLQSQSQEFLLCHSDIHAGNILIGTGGSFYIVDWDDPILAPKERDLMFVGGGIGGVWNNAREETLFYEGYGQTEIDPIALAYYRHERIVQDIAVYCEQIFLTNKGGTDREQFLRNVKSDFLPNRTIEIAYKSLRNE